MAAPIIHHILPTAVLDWQTPALVKRVIWSGTAFVACGTVVLGLPVVACLGWRGRRSMGVLVRALAMVRAIAFAVRAIVVVALMLAVALRESATNRGKRQGQDDV